MIDGHRVLLYGWSFSCVLFYYCYLLFLQFCVTYFFLYNFCFPSLICHIALLLSRWFFSLLFSFHYIHFLFYLLFIILPFYVVFTVSIISAFFFSILYCLFFVISPLFLDYSVIVLIYSVNQIPLSHYYLYIIIPPSLQLPCQFIVLSCLSSASSFSFFHSHFSCYCFSFSSAPLSVCVIVLSSFSLLPSFSTYCGHFSCS